jgi:hypothetical protein
MTVSGQRNSPAALPPEEEPSGTHRREGSVGPRAGLDAVESLAHARNQTPAAQPETRSYTNWATELETWSTLKHQLGTDTGKLRKRAKYLDSW